MPTILNVLSPRALPAGVTVSPEAAIPGNLRGLYFYAEVLTASAPVSCIISLLVELSSDGGATWVESGGITTNGGTHVGRDGTTPENPRFAGGYMPTGGGARARLTTTLSEPATVGLQITVDPVIPQARQA